MSAAANPESSVDDRYQAIYQRMLRAAKTVVVTDADGLPMQPLASLNLDATQDFTLALLSGWAVVADILSFYLDRIADEGYLNSAVEADSVYYLAAGIGYQPWPGAASDTWLAVTVASQSVPQDRNPVTAVSIPPGTSLVVQNIPAQGALPVFFEAEDEAEVRVEWNQLLPVLPMTSVAPAMTAGMTGIRLAGAVTSVKAGSPLLLVSASTRQFRMLDTVDVQRSLGYTAVTWQQGLEAPASSHAGPEEIQAAYVLRQQTGLFGRLAPAWSSAPDTARSLTGTRSGGVLALSAGGLSWKSVQGQLPAVPVRALLCAGSNPTLFAATQSGLYATTGPEWSGNWAARPTSNSRQDLYCLLLDDRGFLYAGGTRGSISCSKDLGQSWQSLSLPIAQAAPDQPWWKKLLTWLHLTSAPAATPLPPYNGVVRAVASGASGKSRAVFLGTDSGVFELPDAGEQWQPFSEGLPGYNSTSRQSSITVFALRFDSMGKALLAGTSAGLYSRGATGSGANQWKAVPLPAASQPSVFAVFSQPGGRQDVLYAGTSAGLFITGIGGKWQQESAVPVTSSVNGFAIAGNYLLAATSAGLFYMNQTSGTWASRNQQEVALFSVDNAFSDALNRGQVPELLVELFAANGVTLASTPKATSRGTDCWQTEDYLLRANGDLLAVSGIGPLTQNAIQAVATDSDGSSFLAGPTGGFLESEWPGFQLTGGSVALDRIASAVQPGDYTVFDQPSPQPATVILEVESSDQTPFQEFTRKATVTVLNLRADPSLGLLRQRDTTVYLKPSALALYIGQYPQSNMIGGNTITVAGDLSSLAERQMLSVSGRAPVVIVPPNVDRTLPEGVKGVPLKETEATTYTASTASLASDIAELNLETVSPALSASFEQHGITLNNAIVTIVEPGSMWTIYSDAGSGATSPAGGFLVELVPSATGSSELQFADIHLLSVQAAVPYPSDSTSASDPQLQWTLSDGKTSYTLIATSSQLVFCPSNPANPDISEIISLKSATVSDRKDKTACVFEAPLANLYDPASVSLTANLVHATQGSTIAAETLGNGDATIPNQSFTLQRPPVTWLSGGECTLAIYVSSNSGVPAPAAPILNSLTMASPTPAGDPWTRVETLFGAAPGATVYTLTTDSRGASTVTFGDGVQGSRLPTGYGNVVAAYRTGLGPTVMPPGSLTVFRNRPAGIRAVTNPVPAQGGTNPEAVPSMRSRMTFSARSIDRIVSLNDYQSFSLSQDEVIKAHVDTVVTDAAEPVIYLTVGVRGNLPIEAMPGAAERLTQAILAARASNAAFQAAGFNSVYFSLQARIHPNGTVKPGVLQANVRSALVNAFSFDLRLFAQDVTAADVITAIQNVDGVYDASLDELCINGETPGVFRPPATPPPLKSNPPRWDPVRRKILPADLLIINPATASTEVRIVIPSDGAADDTAQTQVGGQP